ncbi:MAG: ComF family protein [Elusimicrobia bacterium]|nr:ComF family protein [Elusimicrobiota bacterium]
MDLDPGSIGKYLLNVVLPATCAHCGLDLHYLDDAPLCPACSGGLEPLPALRCEACGLPLDSGGRSCRDCRGGAPRSLALARSAFVFNPQLRSLVHAFKYRAREDLAAFLAEKMASAFPAFPELAPYTFAAAVPLHPAKRRERGFNQAELLAAALAPSCGLFHLEGAAGRTRNTKSQTTLSKEKRRSNIAGAFAIIKPELVKGRNILLVDDVATTLATLEELASEFKKAGARSVAAYTLAREP